MRLSSQSSTTRPAGAAVLLLLLGQAAADGMFLGGPVKMACPKVHVFAARETTAPPGFGTANDLVELLIGAVAGVTTQPIDYPALGGENYTSSVSTGVTAVLAQLAFFNMQCPNSTIIMHGYSQGGQIMDDAFCGGPDGDSLADLQDLIQPGIASQVAAVILMGNPRHNVGISFNVGNATEPGFASRPANFSCPAFADRIQSYCDSPDPFCAKGDDAVYHQQYGKIYGDQALHFILGKLAAR